MEEERAEGALAGVTVLDVTDSLAAYTARLLGDLGADVIRLELPGTDLAGEEPMVALSEQPVSAYALFVNAGKRSVELELEESEGRATFEALIADADILVEGSRLVLEEMGLDPDRLRELNEGLVHVQVTAFGRDQQPSWHPADDLVLMATGGLLHLGGYPDLGPVVAYGGQSRFAASIFAATAAVAALIGREAGGPGVLLDVSAQECVAQALEDSAATYALTGHVRDRQGERPREAGTGVFPCADGFVSMVAGRLGTARAWASLVAWLNEEGADDAARLAEPEWADFAFRQTENAIEEFSDIFGRFAMQRRKQELYDEAQKRLIALSPVSTVADLLGNPQLEHRGFFRKVEQPAFGGHGTVLPGAPYRLSATPLVPPRPAPGRGQDTAEVVGRYGVGRRRRENGAGPQEGAS